MASRPQLFSGARGVFKVTQPSGTVQAFAFATDISVNVRHAVRPSFVIGDMNAIAIDSLSYDVDVSVGRLVPVNSSIPTTAILASPVAPATVAGPAMSAGSVDSSAIATGMETKINAILISNDIEITIYDRSSGTVEKVLASIKGCRFSGRSQSLNAQDVLQERLNFVGIYDAGYGGDSNTATLGYGFDVAVTPTAL